MEKPESSQGYEPTREEYLMLKDHEWILSIHNVQIRQTWQTFYFFLVMNGIVVSAFAYLLVNQLEEWDNLRAYAIYGLTILGVLLGFAWCALISRGLRYCEFWFKKARDIENEEVFMRNGKSIFRTLSTEGEYDIDVYMSAARFAGFKGAPVAKLIPIIWILLYIVLCFFVILKDAGVMG